MQMSHTSTNKKQMQSFFGPPNTSIDTTINFNIQSDQKIQNEDLEASKIFQVGQKQVDHGNLNNRLTKTET